MAEQDIIVKIKAEGANEFIREVKKAGVEVEQVGDKAEKTGDRLTTSFKKVGAALAAAFAAAEIGQFIKESVRLADVQLKAEAQLLKALKGRQDVQQRLLKQAQEIQKTTIFGDEEIIRQQSFLAQLQFTEKQINEIINASVNLSAGLDISLDSAVRNVAKTFSGLSGELGELVPQLRGLTQEQLKSGEAVKLLSGLFEGQAATLRATGTGGVAALQNAFGDLREEMGKAILEGIQPLAFGLTSIIENRAVIGVVQGLGRAIGGIIRPIGIVVKSIGDLLSVIPSLRREVEDLEAVVKPAGQEILDGLLNTEEGIIGIQGSIEKFIKDISRFTSSELKAVKEVIEGELLVAQEEYNAALQDGSVLLQDLAKNDIKLYENAIASIDSRIKGLAKTQGDANEETEKSIVLLNQFFEEFRSGFISAAGTFNDVTLYANILDMLGKSIEDLQKITEGGLLGDQDEDLQAFAKNTQLATKGVEAIRKRIQEQEAAELSRSDKALNAFEDINTAQQNSFALFRTIQNRQKQILDNRLAQGLISEKEYQQELARLRTKEARAAKAQAIFDATIGIATAIIRALGRPILQAIIAATGAAQIATIAATPIPQFAKGTKGKKKAPAGFKWVGEEGPELLYDKGGYNIMTAKDSDQIAKLLGSYGIPTQFKGKTTINEIDRPLKSLSKLKGTPLEKMDWGPMLNASDRQRMSLGRKLDKIHTAIVKGQSFNRPMTRA